MNAMPALMNGTFSPYCSVIRVFNMKSSVLLSLFARRYIEVCYREKAADLTAQALRSAETLAFARERHETACICMSANNKTVDEGRAL